MESQLILHPGLLALYGSNIEAARHAHTAIQIVWPVAGEPWVINGESGSGAALVGSNAPHGLDLAAGWIILLEPQSDPGRRAQKRLQGLDWCVLPSLPDYQPHPQEQDDHPLRPVWRALDMPDRPDSSPAVNDARLHSLLQRLDACFQEGGIDPSAWRAAEIAKLLSLSTSRFLHVFRAQMGIAWRPYLRWRRLLCAVQALRQGQSATHAALAAGFADSAHLSRTFRATFGMSVREALANFR